MLSCNSSHLWAQIYSHAEVPTNKKASPNSGLAAMWSRKVCGNIASLALWHLKPLRSRGSRNVGESSQDAAQPSLAPGSSHVALRVRNLRQVLLEGKGTAGGESPTPKASLARLAGMSNPCPRPVMHTGKQNNAWEQPGTQSRAGVPGPGSRRRSHPPRSYRGNQTRARRGRRGRALRRPPGWALPCPR